MRRLPLRLALASATLLLGHPSAGAQVTTVTIPEVTTTTEATTTTTTSSTTAAPETTTTTEASSAPAATGLSISVPETANLSTGTSLAAGSLAAQLGPVTVHVDGSVVARAWTATVSASDFATADGTGQIPRASIAYASGLATISGAGTAVPGQVDVVAAEPLDTTRTAFTGVGALTATTVTWNPVLVVTFPTTATAGDYSGTITHSAA